VLVALGSQRAVSVLTEMLPLCRHPKANVREGVIWLLCFMPGAMGRSFTPLIADALPIIIAGLSDDADGVREVNQYDIHAAFAPNLSFCDHPSVLLFGTGVWPVTEAPDPTE
jgi:hypothetical protein